MSGRVEFIKYKKEDDWKIENPKIDGYYKIKLFENMVDGGTSKDNANHIFFNAYKSLQYLVNPYIGFNKLNKILCLGKVQSGKTAFFISSIALAFDNGYDLAYVIGGTKTKLKNQNFDRLSADFSNNKNVKVIDVTKKDYDDPLNFLEKGYKVIIVALKNISSEKANLGKIQEISEELKDYPSIVVDDEGDECSPGAPKLKKKNNKAGRTHDVIADIINNIHICTFLSVTATPQANFLISTIDELSPDYAVLVEPGKGYTGGNAFHDIYENRHVIEIKDSDDFVNSVPDSFISALYFYIFSILTHLYRGDYKPYSMLIHPSSLTKVQTMVSEKITDCLANVKSILSNPYDFSHDSVLKSIYESSNECVSDFISFEDFKNKISDKISLLVEGIDVYEFNVSSTGKQDILRDEKENKFYKIYIGGNMLGRGLTIKNLNVTYMYRDSKVTQIDTLYQRARWFGYKSKYFDLCRVYMTKELKRKFIDTVENENDMWKSIKSFLVTKTNIKQFPRIFTLKNDKLRLTRGTISKTVVVDRVHPGYDYDKTIFFSKEQFLSNKNLYRSFYEKYKNDGKEIQFGKSATQQHLVIEMTYTKFYYEFLSKYEFQRNSKFGLLSFTKLLELIQSGDFEDKISVVLMRYKTNEYRSITDGGKGIKELPQSYDNGTEYPGDKDLTNLKDIFHIQIHPVYVNEDKPDEIIPLLALNNPITPFNVRHVTGENNYGEI